ncbi:MAG: DNA alkylation repair protein [Intestinibacter sp.]
MDLRNKLFELSDEKYKKFHSGLCPNTDNIIGVRLPQLRQIAKEIAKGDWRGYLENCLEDYYEENLINGLVIAYAKCNVEEKLQYIKGFVPKIDNWAVCDSFCNSLKFTTKNKETLWEFLQPYLNSSKEFEVRFAVVMMLNYYITEEYIDIVLKSLDKINHNGYYVKMAVAWAVSICFIHFEDKTMDFLKNNNLDDFTYNKSLQKICESLRVDKYTKVLIKSMKRKNNNS